MEKRAGSTMKYRRSNNPIILSAMFVGLYILAGCGMSTTTSSGNSADSGRAGIWAISGTPLDSGTVFDVTPQLAVQPSGGGGAVAVWIKRIDLDPADGFPAIYHLYATHLTGGIPDANDSACPFGNPDATGNDGVCEIDTGNAQYDALSPKVSMDNNGDAVVVWQQHDGTAQRVYARRYSGGSWGPFQRLNDSIEYANFDAGDPVIALEPDPANDGGTDDGAGSAMAAWSQYNEKDWTISLDSTATYNSVYSMAVSNGELYAGMGGGGAGDGDVFAYNPGSGSWTLFLDNLAGSGYTRVDSMVDYGGKLYVGYGGATGFGDVASYDSSTNTWTTVFQTGTPALNSGQYDSVRSMAVFQCSACTGPQLYIGLGNSVGVAEVYTCSLCDGTDWVRVLDSVTNSFQAVTAMGVYNNQLYIGLNATGVNAAVYRCSACAGDASDWTQVFLNGAYDSVRSMAVHNGLIYIGMGDGGDDGDVYRCDFSSTGCDQTTDWTQVLESGAAYEAVPSMISYNGYLYIGLGESAAGDGDIEWCLVCDGTDWTFSRNEGTAPFTPATYEAVNSLAAYSGELFAGFGNTIPNGDILRFSAGWQTVARRLVNGVWDTTDTICPAGSGVDDGICYVSGVLGTALQPTQSPRVKVDNFGRAIVAFVQIVVQTDCVESNPPPNATAPSDLINCPHSTLQANLFDGTSWQSTIDLGPGLNSVAPATPPLVLCFENATGADPPFPGGRGDSGSTDACVHVIDFDLAVSPAGQAALLIKTSWNENEDFLTGCVGDSTHIQGGPSCLPDGNAYEDYMGQAIVARLYTMGAAWVTGNWTLDWLANFGYANGTYFGTGPFAPSCPSSTTFDGLRVVLNCHFSHPRIAVSPGGSTAIAVYESYGGSFYDIQANRYDGTTWGGFTTIDAGGGDAHAPEIAMDNAGNGVAVWTQNDGTQYRIESNCYAPAAGVGTCGNVVSTGWQGATNVDGGAGSESAYYSPLVDLAAPGGANSALSLFLGWSILDNSTRVYSATGP